MAKEYFPHDFCARTTLREIRKDYGLEGLGFYWCLVEILHEEGGSIKASELDSIAYELRADSNMAADVVKKYGLFKVQKGVISCDRVVRNLKKREELSEARKAAAEARWGRPDEELPTIELPEGEEDPEFQERSKMKAIGYIRKCFDDFLEHATMNELLSHNIYAYKDIFDSVIEEVRNKDYVIINRKNVPTYKFLQVISHHINKSGEIRGLEIAIMDVQDRYIKGKIKNRTNYLISALYNSALLDCEDILKRGWK